MHPFFYGFAECGRKENYVQSVHWLYCSCLVTMDRFTIYSSSAGHRLHSLLKSIKCLFQVQLFKQCEVFKDYENHVEKYFYWEFFFFWTETPNIKFTCVLFQYITHSSHSSVFGRLISEFLSEQRLYNDKNFHSNVSWSRFT